MGHTPTEETRRLQSLAKLGKKMSDEARKNMSINHPKSTSNKVKHIDTGLEFCSLTEGCKYFGYSYGAQNRAMQKGFTTKKFIYTEKENNDYFFNEYGVKDGECVMIKNGEKYSSIEEGCKINNLNYSHQMKAYYKKLKTLKFKLL